MMSPLDGGPIIYDRSYIVADRQAQRAYLCGVDKDKRLYVVAIEYAKRPSPLTLYYTDPLPDCGFYVPALTPQGNLVIAGGSSKPDYDSDNFTPVASAWLIPLGRPDDVTATSSRWSSCLLWCLLAVAVVLLSVAWFVIYRRKTMAAQLARQAAEQVEQEADLAIKREELLARVCQLMDKERLYLHSDLKVQDLAVRLDTNSTYVSECINSGCGQTFTQFVNTYRVRHAQQLFREKPEVKTGTIAEESGFSSEVSFYRIFKAVTGITPREWRLINKIANKSPIC